MNIINDFKSFIDDVGFISPYLNGGGSGNGLRYTAEYIIALVDNNSLTEEEKNRIINAYHSCELKNGLMMRRPDNGFGHEGPDDYVGCGTFSYFVDNGELAKRILDYGNNESNSFIFENERPQILTSSKIVFNILSIFGLKKVHRVYNNINPGSFTLMSFLGRFPGLFAHLKFACGQKPNAIEKLFWCGSLIDSMLSSTDERDKHTLVWHYTRVADGKSIICDLFIKLWRYVFLKKVPGGISQNLYNYFTFEHPSVKWLANSK